ncbi:TrfB-related DNA-binding protein [Nitrosovibrio sp. Nv6]|uniref:TrfB-related DNA-binding protein n=1 Tax=Nitrosovibrio sp. Nv6 TaxID=1855340 RepID=UPI0008CFB6CB|nr:TrfB-related DNA-binding protein [Nitrosovibrio sp. Nv6]SEP43366.1 TrfB transcriptional repressor [Nitrosovibrio sp. Nv6]
MQRLTAKEFDAAVRASRMGEKTRAWARSVLVDGRRFVDVAADYKVNRQNVQQAVRQVLKWNQREKGMEVLLLHPDLAARFRGLMEEAEQRTKRSPK